MGEVIQFPRPKPDDLAEDVAEVQRENARRRALMEATRLWLAAIDRAREAKL